MTEPVILAVLALFPAFVVVVLLRLDERITRLEALVKCLESENIALRRKLNNITEDK